MECNVCFTSWLSQNTELIFSRNILLQPQDVITDWYRSVQSPACEIGFNPQILLYIYLHWKPFAIFQSLTLKKLFYNFSVFPYPCYPEKLHQHSLSSHHLSLFPGHMMMLYSADSAKSLRWLFFSSSAGSPPTHCFLLCNQLFIHSRTCCLIQNVSHDFTVWLPVLLPLLSLFIGRL